MENSLIIILISAYSFIIAFCLYRISKISYLYLADGADQRSPYIVMGYLVTIIICISLIIFTKTGYSSSLTSCIIFFYYTAILSSAGAGRLMGYKTSSFNLYVKRLLYIMNMIFMTVLFVIILQEFSFVSFEMDSLTLSNYAITFSTFFISRYSNIIIIYFIIGALIGCTINLVFDLIEQRSKRNIIYDIINYIPIIIFVLFHTINVEILLDYYIITAIMASLFIYIPYMELNKEAKSIIRHATGIDIRISLIKRIIKNLDFNKMTAKQNYQLEYIHKIFTESPDLKEVCLSDRFIKNKKVKILEHIFEKLDEMKTNNITSDAELLSNICKAQH